MAAPATNDPLGSDDPSPQSNISTRTIDENLDTEKLVLSADNQIIGAKRPRGRPPGSKNKPKPPTFIPVGPNNAFSSHVMEINPGADVISSLVEFARVKRTGIAVLHAIGSLIGTISFRHEGPFHGRFEIISLGGIVMPDGSSGPSSLSLFVTANEPPSPAKVIGGVVNGPIVTAGPVFVTAASFSPTTIEKLPLKLEPGLVMGQEPGSGGYTPVYSNTEMGSGGGGYGGSQYSWVSPSLQEPQRNNSRRSLYFD